MGSTSSPRPQRPPLSVLCPLCMKLLSYQLTSVSGQNPSERSDYFLCTRCLEPFEYKHRTRTMQDLAKNRSPCARAGYHGKTRDAGRPISAKC